MRTKFMNLRRVLLVGGVLALAACGSSGGSSGTGGSSGGGTGGATGTGGSMSDGGADATTGTGGASAHQNHLNIINATTTGGIPVSRTPPIDYNSCKI
jgi:hypothetical protein